MFDSESKSISTRTMRRKLKGLGLNSCVALRKPIISEANWKQRLKFAREHIDWTLEQWKKVMWSDESRFTLFQSDGRIRVRGDADEVMPSSCLVPTVQTCGGQCYDLGLLQLVRSRFSNVMSPKNLVSWLPQGSYRFLQVKFKSF